MLVVGVALETTGILGWVEKTVLDAVDLISQPIGFSKKLWSICYDALEQLLIPLNEWKIPERARGRMRCGIRWAMCQSSSLCADFPGATTAARSAPQGSTSSLTLV